MEWIATIVVGVLALIGTISGAYMANRKSAALIAYRLKELEERVGQHNNFARRMPVVEEQVKVINHRLADLEEYHK